MGKCWKHGRDTNVFLKCGMINKSSIIQKFWKKFWEKKIKIKGQLWLKGEKNQVSASENLNWKLEW